MTSVFRLLVAPLVAGLVVVASPGAAQTPAGRAAPLVTPGIPLLVELGQGRTAPPAGFFGEMGRIGPDA